MLLTLNKNLGIQTFSHFDIPTKYPSLIDITISVPITSLTTLHACTYLRQKRSISFKTRISGRRRQIVNDQHSRIWDGICDSEGPNELCDFEHFSGTQIFFDSCDPNVVVFVDVYANPYFILSYLQNLFSKKPTKELDNSYVLTITSLP